MECNKTNHGCYVFVNSQLVEVSAEVQTEYRRQITQIRTNAQAEGRCMNTDYHRCTGECYGCPYHCEGILTSLDAMMAENVAEDKNLLLATTDEVEETIINREMWDSVYRYADSVVKHGALILRMIVVERQSGRQVASILGVDHRLVDRRLKRILSGLRQNDTKFF